MKNHKQILEDCIQEGWYDGFAVDCREEEVLKAMHYAAKQAFLAGYHHGFNKAKGNESKTFEEYLKNLENDR